METNELSLLDSDHLVFKNENDKFKHKRIKVFYKSNETFLGKISWYEPWRQYCFYPQEVLNAFVVFDKGCLLDIADTISLLTAAERRV